MSTALTEEQKVAHLLNRTSFGPTREAVQRVNRLGIRAYLDEQLHPERISDTLVEEKAVNSTNSTRRQNKPNRPRNKR